MRARATRTHAISDATYTSNSPHSFFFDELFSTNSFLSSSDSFRLLSPLSQAISRFQPTFILMNVLAEFLFAAVDHDLSSL